MTILNAGFPALQDLINKPIKIFELQLPFTLTALIVKGVIPLIVVLVLFRLTRSLQEKSLAKGQYSPEKKQKLRKVVRFVFRTLIFGTVTVSAAVLLNEHVPVYLEMFWKSLSDPFFTSGNTSVSFLTLALLIPIFLVANWVGRLTQGFIEANLFERIQIDEARRFTFGMMSRYAAGAVVVLAGLAVIGIDLSAIGVILGVLGIGLGFGLQSIVANFFAGLLIISTRPIKENDRILIGGIEGTVRRIKLISTNVVTLANENIIIPNAELVSKPVHNLSYQDRRVVTTNIVSVAYDTDLERAVEVLRECAESVPLVMADPPPVVRVQAFEDSGIRMAVFSWIATVEDRKLVESEINMEIWRAFRREGIVIPFPQHEVRILKDIVIPPEGK